MVILHHRTKAWPTADTGHLVEHLLVGRVEGSFLASTILRIGGHRVLVTSEVDGTLPPPPADGADRLVEIKSTTKGRSSVLGKQGLPVQLTCNGSVELAIVHVSNDSQRVDSVEWLDAESVRHEHCRDRNIYAGQRVRVLLDRLFDDAGLLRGANATPQCDQDGDGGEDDGAPRCGHVLKIEFDEGKAPVVTIADIAAGVTVVPEGLE